MSSEPDVAVAEQSHVLARLLRLRIGDQPDIWVELPGWTKFLLELGAVLADLTLTGRSLRALVILPVARYAAPLMSLSLLLERYLADPWLSEDLEAHVELLQDLPAGTAVILRTEKRVFRGHFLGPAVKAGAECYGVKLQNEAAGGLGKWIPRVAALKIQPDPQGISKLPINPEGKRITSDTSLLNPLIGPASYTYVNARRRELALIGPRALLAQEFENLRLYGPGGTATLQELVRVREFGGNKGRFASDWIGPRVRELPWRAPVAIFTRATDFLRAAPRWTDSHWVVLCEAGDDHLADGVQGFVDAYHEENGTTLQLSLRNPAPVGSHVWAYRVTA